MKVVRHRLQSNEGEPVPFVRTPNSSGPLDPKYLVIHFTAGRSAEQSVNWLTNPLAHASAHLVIARDGAVTQLLPFNRMAWHAGASQWEGLLGLNRHSIGIELDNAGRLTHKGPDWCAWFGDPYPEDEVMPAVHKHEVDPCGWHVFPPEQIEKTFEVALCIMQKYALRDVVGHDDISPGRKVDPGPAFPMASFRSRLVGRAQDELPVFQTITTLNIRTGPGTQHEKLEMGPLPPNTLLTVVREEGIWRLVNLEQALGGEIDVQGWVHGSYIRRVE